MLKRAFGSSFPNRGGGNNYHEAEYMFRPALAHENPFGKSFKIHAIHLSHVCGMIDNWLHDETYQPDERKERNEIRKIVSKYENFESPNKEIQTELKQWVNDEKDFNWYTICFSKHIIKLDPI